MATILHALVTFSLGKCSMLCRKLLLKMTQEFNAAARLLTELLFRNSHKSSFKTATLVAGLFLGPIQCVHYVVVVVDDDDVVIIN